MAKRQKNRKKPGKNVAESKEQLNAGKGFPIHLPTHIDTSYQGVERIIRLYHDSKNVDSEYILFDFASVTHIDANMSALLGGIIEQLKNEGKNLQYNIEKKYRADKTLRKNGFYNIYCGEKLDEDKFETILDYKHFKNHDDKAFSYYVNEFFKPTTNGFQNFSYELLKMIRRMLNEVSLNTHQHAESSCGFITCGQLFPRQETFKFSMVDTGIGFAEHIYKNRNLHFSGEKAIKWALTGDNTARPIECGIPGGLGLKMIKKFIKENHGEMYIISHSGYYELIRGTERYQNMHLPFPGTAVSLCISVA